MRPEDAHLLTPGTKVVIKNDFYKHPVDSLRKYLGTEMTVSTVHYDGTITMKEGKSSVFYIQEIDYIVEKQIDCGDEEYQTVDIADLFT